MKKAPAKPKAKSKTKACKTKPPHSIDLLFKFFDVDGKLLAEAHGTRNRQRQYSVTPFEPLCLGKMHVMVCITEAWAVPIIEKHSVLASSCREKNALLLDWLHVSEWETITIDSLVVKMD